MKYSPQTITSWSVIMNWGGNLSPRLSPPSLPSALNCLKKKNTILGVQTHLVHLYPWEFYILGQLQVSWYYTINQINRQIMKILFQNIIGILTIIELLSYFSKNFKKLWCWIKDFCFNVNCMRPAQCVSYNLLELYLIDYKYTRICIKYLLKNASSTLFSSCDFEFYYIAYSYTF